MHANGNSEVREVDPGCSGTMDRPTCGTGPIELPCSDVLHHSRTRLASRRYSLLVVILSVNIMGGTCWSASEILIGGSLQVEFLTDDALTQLPQPLGRFLVSRMIRRLCDLTVAEIRDVQFRTQLGVESCHQSRRGTLVEVLPEPGSLADEILMFLVQVPGQIRPDGPRMSGDGPDPMTGELLCQGDREENVCRLGLPVRYKRDVGFSWWRVEGHAWSGHRPLVHRQVFRAFLEIRVTEPDRRDDVALAGEIDNAS